MSMLKICSVSGCGTRTLGVFCVEHEARPVESAAVAARRARTTVHTVGQAMRNQIPNASNVNRRDQSASQQPEF